MSLRTGSIVSRASDHGVFAAISYSTTPKLEQPQYTSTIRPICMQLPRRSAQPAPACAGAGQITGRLRLRAATAALHCAGSEFCRSKGLTRATLRSPKRQGLRAQPSGSEADFGPGGLATGLENYRPIILSTTQAAFVSILYLYNLNLQPNQRILHHRILHIIETRRLKILAVT